MTPSNRASNCTYVEGVLGTWACGSWVETLDIPAWSSVLPASKAQWTIGGPALQQEIFMVSRVYQYFRDQDDTVNGSTARRSGPRCLVLEESQEHVYEVFASNKLFPKSAETHNPARTCLHVVTISDSPFVDLSIGDQWRAFLESEHWRSPARPTSEDQPNEAAEEDVKPNGY